MAKELRRRMIVAGLAAGFGAAALTYAIDAIKHPPFLCITSTPLEINQPRITSDDWDRVVREHAAAGLCNLTNPAPTELEGK
jgi:hypothetical protein